MRKLIPSLVLLPVIPLLLWASGCAAIVGVGAGLVISQELMDNNTYVTHLNSPIRDVWPVCKSTLSDSSLGLVDVDEELRVARAKVDGATVTVAAEAYDNDKTVIRVMARRYGLNDGDSAQVVSDKIILHLQDQ